MFNDFDKPLVIAGGTLKKGVDGEYDPFCGVILRTTTLTIYSYDTKEKLYVIPIEKVELIEKYYYSTNPNYDNNSPRRSAFLDVLVSATTDIFSIIRKKNNGNGEKFLKVRFNDENNVNQVLFFSDPVIKGIDKKFNKLKQEYNR